MTQIFVLVCIFLGISTPGLLCMESIKDAHVPGLRLPSTPKTSTTEVDIKKLHQIFNEIASLFLKSPLPLCKGYLRQLMSENRIYKNQLFSCFCTMIQEDEKKLTIATEKLRKAYANYLEVTEKFATLLVMHKENLKEKTVDARKNPLVDVIMEKDRFTNAFFDCEKNCIELKKALIEKYEIKNPFYLRPEESHLNMSCDALVSELSRDIMIRYPQEFNNPKLDMEMIKKKYFNSASPLDDYTISSWLYQYGSSKVGGERTSTSFYAKKVEDTFRAEVKQLQCCYPSEDAFKRAAHFNADIKRRFLAETFTNLHAALNFALGTVVKISTRLCQKQPVIKSHPPAVDDRSTPRNSELPDPTDLGNKGISFLNLEPMELNFEELRLNDVTELEEYLEAVYAYQEITTQIIQRIDDALLILFPDNSLFLEEVYQKYQQYLTAIKMVFSTHRMVLSMRLPQKTS